jgi:hypothetical protein
LLKTGPDDRTPLYGRPFKCKACGSREVVLYAIDDQAELDAIQRAWQDRGIPPRRRRRLIPTMTPTRACC